MILKYGSLYFPKVSEHDSFPVGNQQSSIRQSFLDMIRFQTAFRSTAAFGHSGKVRNHQSQRTALRSTVAFGRSAASGHYIKSRRAIFFPIPASHLCLHSGEPARYSNTVPFQYSIITSPFQQ